MQVQKNSSWSYRGKGKVLVRTQRQKIPENVSILHFFENAKTVPESAEKELLYIPCYNLLQEKNLIMTPVEFIVSD